MPARDPIMFQALVFPLGPAQEVLEEVQKRHYWEVLQRGLTSKQSIFWGRLVVFPW